MNRKMWFYSTSMSLLMLVATYIAFNADGETWEDFKGADCLDSKIAPSSATTPPNCTLWTLCSNRTTNGTHGYCITTHAITNRVGLGVVDSAGDYITRQERTCQTITKWKIPVGCSDKGVDIETGKLKTCNLSSC